MLNTYLIDPSHSTASFSIKHMMIAKVRGGFEKLSGKLEYDPQDLSKAKVEANIDISSISTRDTKRDEQLKSADFFDALKYPTITFTSKKFKKDGDELKITGDLTIHGVTKKVELNVEGPTEEIKDPKGNITIGASGTTKIKRKDFGLSWNAALEAGGIMVGNDVNVTLEVQFTKII